MTKERISPVDARVTVRDRRCHEGRAWGTGCRDGGAGRQREAGAGGMGEASA